MYRLAFKPILDFFISFIIILITLPILIFVTVVLFISNQGKPFYYQLRPGKNNKIFKIIKFKTMNDKKDTDGKLLSDADRLTSIGSFIRKTSLDELPQLINVIKGEMSLIGPRPLLPEYLPLYNESQKRRHEVKPGITGRAQINGRNAISWEKKFEHDLWYVDNISLKTDCKILLITFIKVFKKEGVSSKGYVSTSAFNGTN